MGNIVSYQTIRRRMRLRLMFVISIRLLDQRYLAIVWWLWCIVKSKGGNRLYAKAQQTTKQAIEELMAHAKPGVNERH